MPPHEDGARNILNRVSTYKTSVLLLQNPGLFWDCCRRVLELLVLKECIIYGGDFFYSVT